ncbi:MAG: DEAD/DEAH box helicase [Muribaculaceae bacterium]|nr:DEAD/DEAH box helicase [Muribaculaceae bacterium]
MLFEDFDLSDNLLDALDAMHFVECTPIQEQAIPVILDRRDLIAIAQTGTGKTAAYLLPVIDLLAELPEADGFVNCIVMAPTRELAQQIERQMDGFSYFLPLSSIAVYGGTDGAGFARQQKGMREGADVVIATPGRLQALLQMGGIDLSKVRYFILDEADRMLDMGFYDDIMAIVKHLPKERQTLLFSATMPPKIRKLAQSVLNDPAEVRIAPSRPVEKIKQSAIFCYDDDKQRLLTDMLKARRGERIIVFAASKHGVRDLARDLRRQGLKAAEIHSDLDQQQREETIRGFRSGRIEIIVATDLLARGIDIDDVMLVVNYDVPREPEDYVHRVGRTARANADGEAITLVSPRDRRAFSRVESTLKIKIAADNRLSSLPKGNADRSDSAASRTRDRKPGGGGHKPSPRHKHPDQEKTTTQANQPDQTKQSGHPKASGNRKYYGKRRQGGKKTPRTDSSSDTRPTPPQNNPA